MKSKYSNNTELKKLSSQQIIDNAKQKNSTTFWRSVILSSKLNKIQLESILPFVRGLLNVNLILEKTGYPKNSHRIIGKLAQAVKNTGHGERRRLIRRVFRKPSKESAIALAKKIDTIDAWCCLVLNYGHVMKVSDLMELGNRFQDQELWINIIDKSSDLKNEQILSIKNSNCFLDKKGYYQELLSTIIQKICFKDEYSCIDILIEYLDLRSGASHTTVQKELDLFKKFILERVDWTKPELVQLIKLYYRTNEKLLLEMIFLRCVTFSKQDVAELLRTGHKVSKDYILSKVMI